MINTNVFKELTPDVAYWVGYFSAGGNCTTENKVRLVSTPENEDLLISFRNFIGRKQLRYEISYIKENTINARLT